MWEVYKNREGCDKITSPAICKKPQKCFTLLRFIFIVKLEA